MDFIASETLTPADEARYVSTYLPLVNKVVKQLAYQTSSVIDRDDMEQIALMGLLTSLRRYGHPDEQFAAYAIQRVRGAVLDELRLLDWRPRRLRQKTHKLNDAIREIARQLGVRPALRISATIFPLRLKSIRNISYSIAPKRWRVSTIFWVMTYMRGRWIAVRLKKRLSSAERYATRWRVLMSVSNLFSRSITSMK